MSFSNTFNKDSLAKIFKDAFGESVTDDEISLWIDNLYKQITIEEHNELFKYLLLKNIIVDKPSPQPQESLDYLLTYTTPVWDNNDVICREDIISELFAKFSKGTRRIQVAGMGGLGKSEILVKLFFQLTQLNPPVQFDYIGFIRFNDDLESNLISQIPYLADYASKNGEEAARLFLQQLCATNRVLFCIDDNRDKKDILKKNDPSFAFLKTLSASLLFASRTEYAEFEQQQLPLLPTVACIKIVKRILEREFHDPNEIAILTNIIENMSGNNTLIVNRLGYMILEHNCSISKLQKNLQDKGFHIKKDSVNEAELQQEINKLYPLSELTKQGERSIVEAFSIFPINPLSIDLCVEWLHEDAGIDDEECSLALTRLSKQTWLEKRIDASNGEVLFSMHQCVKSALKDQTTVEYSAHQKLVEGCRISLNSYTKDYQLQKSSAVIPFAIPIYNELFQELSPFLDLSSAIAFYYRIIANDFLALLLYRKDLDIMEKVLGKDHPDTATTYNNIARIYDSLGQYARALEWYQKSLAILEKVLGIENPYTATSYNNIALVYDSLGQYDLALEWFQKALVILEKVLGEDHQYTALTYNNIACVYKNQGKFELALKWHQRALVFCENILGKDHPQTAISYGNIADIYNALGKYDLALELHQKDLAITEKVFGKDHPDTATTYNNIANIYKKQGECELALQWYQKSLVIREKVLGKDHLSTATTYNDVAGVYMNQGQYDLAFEWLQKALTIYKEVLGEDHPNTIIIKENISYFENMA